MESLNSLQEPRTAPQQRKLVIDLELPRTGNIEGGFISGAPLTLENVPLTYGQYERHNASRHCKAAKTLQGCKTCPIIVVLLPSF